MADLTENMKTPATVDFYTKCVIGEGPCNAVGTALRSLLWDPVPGQPICYGCNESQMQRVRYVIDTMKAQYPLQACKIRAKLGEIRPIFSDVKC
ncbi:uncharacterized protein LOC135220287 [Macrobrachium nipponense]|uniref:uncharacterized protein LOC135220287 n=1 Tax=Macrobrachium nipponense TaxID=159736 RepID=UPI0030C8AF5E